MQVEESPEPLKPLESPEPPKESNTEQIINEKISNRIESLKIDDAQLENDLDLNSFIDDHIMLQAAKTYENIQNSSSKPVKSASKPSKSTNMNMTMVSQEVLNMCDVLERKAVSSKKITMHDAPTTEKLLKSENTARKSLNYSFGERTLKNILNSPTSTTKISTDLDNDELKKIFATQNLTVEVNTKDMKENSKYKQDIVDYFRVLNLTNLNLNIIDDLDQLQLFTSHVICKSLFF